MPSREGGFIVIWRRVQSSALFLALTAEQRSVMLSVLLLANWKPRKLFVGGSWESVNRGELLQSLQSIAAHAKVSVKVVRTTLAKMFADDRAVGGRGPFLAERWIGSGREVGTGSGIAAGTVPGTMTGTPLRVLTIVNYDEYQSVVEDGGTAEGTGSGIAKGTPGARQGHARGTSRTKGTKGTTEASTSSAADAAPDGRFQPFVKLAFDAFAEARGGAALDFDGHDGKRLREFLARQPHVTAEDFGGRWRRALATPRYPGCAKVAHLCERWNELAGAGTNGVVKVTAPALPSTAFTGGRRAL